MSFSTMLGQTSYTRNGKISEEEIYCLVYLISRLSCNTVEVADIEGKVDLLSFII